jgi:hypothetical protein
MPSIRAWYSDSLSSVSGGARQAAGIWFGCRGGWPAARGSVVASTVTPLMLLIVCPPFGPHGPVIVN